MVSLEGASVDAFGTLARELDEHGAPVTLVAAARTAADDEARHTRALRAIARDFGVSRSTAKQPKRRRVRRSLVAIAIENAVDGCVHETFGAAIARFQAARAPRGIVRSAMRKIARDEARHAVLARRVDVWARGRLTIAEAKRVVAAPDAAVARLGCALRAEPPWDLISALGVPTAAQAIALFDSLRSSLAA